MKFSNVPVITTKPDDRGRITLGKLAEGVSSFQVFEDPETGEILLRPFSEIPKNELWLYKNKEAKALVEKGLEDLKESKFSTRKFQQKSWIDDVGEDE